MQVNRVDNQNFKAFNVSKSYYGFYRRLFPVSRYVEFKDIEKLQKNNPLEIIIEQVEKNKNLFATIVDENGKVLYEATENKYRGKFNLSPIKFLKKLSKMADSLNAERNVKS